MNIQFVSKTFGLPENVRQFLEEKLQRLQKYALRGSERMQVIVGRVQKGKSTTSDAFVEVQANVEGKPMAFREIGSNIYQATYRVYEKIETAFSRMREIQKNKKGR